MCGLANVTSWPQSPEIVGSLSNDLRRSISPVTQHDEFVSNLAEISTPTIPSQEGVTDFVGSHPDSSSKRPSHLTPQTSSFASPTGQLMSLGDLVPNSSPCSLTCLYPSIRMSLVVPSSPRAQMVLDLEPPSATRRVRGELEDSSKEDPCQSETRTGCLLGNRSNGDNKPSFQNLRSGRTAQPYSSGRFFRKIDPPLPLRRTIRCRNGNPRRRSYSCTPLAISPSEPYISGQSFSVFDPPIPVGRIINRRNSNSQRRYYRLTLTPPSKPCSGRFFSNIYPPLPLWARRIINRRGINTPRRSYARMASIPPSGPYSSNRFFSKIDPPLPFRRIINRYNTRIRPRSYSRIALIPPSEEPYGSGRFFSKIYPPLPLRRIADRRDSKSRCRSYSRMGLPTPEGIGASLHRAKPRVNLLAPVHVC